MPFLRLTRDRRGFENTFLMHEDRPGDRPRLLYWYRTAPGILLGRAPLDEDAIRTIEEQHPEIEFDWPAILALSEVMTPEEEAPAPRRERKVKPPRQREGRPDTRAADNTDPNAAADFAEDAEFEPTEPVEPDEPVEPVEHVELVDPAEPAEPAERGESAFAREDSGELRRDSADLSADLSAEARSAEEEASAEAEAAVGREGEPVKHPFPDEAQPDAEEVVAPRPHTYGLLEELVGREIATRLRARYSEIGARVHEQYGDASVRDAWMKRAEPLNPDLWLTPEAVLEGVRRADGLFDRLRAELLAHSSRE